MRYVIIGAGAVGATIGGRLHQNGHEALLVARGGHYRALRERGLLLRTPSEALALPVPVIDGPEAVQLTREDVLVLAVKTQDSTAALAAWADRPVVGGGTAARELPVVCAQNGVENERLALRRFRRVYAMCVWLPSQFLESGTVTAGCAPLSGVLHLGRYPGGIDDTSRRISADLEASRFLSPPTEDIMRWKYAKLLTNLANALDAVCGPDRDETARELAHRARGEGTAVLDAAGIAYASDEEQAAVRAGRSEVRPVAGAEPGGGSSWQSLRRGTGSVEADYLNGEIVLLGRLHGVPTPVNDTLRRAVNSFASQGSEPGTMSALRLAELAAGS